MDENERNNLIRETSDKVFDFFNYKGSLNLEQFKSCLRCTTNDIFKEKEIEIMFKKDLKE